MGIMEPHIAKMNSCLYIFQKKFKNQNEHWSFLNYIVRDIKANYIYKGLKKGWYLVLWEVENPNWFLKILRG